jgi:hypothetical protein
MENLTRLHDTLTAPRNHGLSAVWKLSFDLSWDSLTSLSWGLSVLDRLFPLKPKNPI